MTKMQAVPASFECRIEGPGCTIALDREGMPPRSFNVRLTYRNGDGENAARFACGFSVYLDVREDAYSALARIVLRLIRVAPISLDDAIFDRLRDVAEPWFVFNFLTLADAIKMPPPSRESKRVVSENLKPLRIDAVGLTFGKVFS